MPSTTKSIIPVNESLTNSSYMSREKECEISKVTDSGKETIIDTRTEKEKQLDSDWETEQE